MRSALFWFRLGGWLMLLNGPPHLIGLFAGQSATPANPTEAELVRLARDYKFHLMGVERSFQDVNNGLSLSFAFLALLAGTLVLTAARHAREAREAPRMVRDLAIVAALGASVLTAINLLYTVPPPTILLGLSALSFLAAIATSRRAMYP